MAEIDFVTYLRAVEKTQLATFLQSNYGKALVNKKQGNPERVVGKALMDDLAASDPALAAADGRGASGRRRKRCGSGVGFGAGG